jgi:glycosyltransferase involved in cell wall biosynthesis
VDLSERDKIWRRFVGTPPLVSVNIATYNRAEILLERSLPSILQQTYDNLEINIVGDGCTDDTERLIRKVRDPRVRFVNLAERGNYPSDPARRWMVAGTAALNHALSMTTGDFVTHLDDDDEHLPDRIEKLLLFSLSNDCDFVWHPFLLEDTQGNWIVNDAQAPVLGSVTTSAIFYRGWLKTIAWDVEAHWLDEPGDWNRIRRMKLLGPNCMRYPERLLRHYRERNREEYTAQAAA